MQVVFGSGWVQIENPSEITQPVNGNIMMCSDVHNWPMIMETKFCVAFSKGFLQYVGY